ncbi:FG-GAP repeat protein, partial [Gammaproteobacteria bacterium]|nr:FG-GAP repeat protein [Gammaproteobacteria bacterium]
MGKPQKTDALLIGDGIIDGGDGPTVAIEAGANLAFAHSGASLIINRGARIVAEGNAQNPITFTSYGDTKGTQTSEEAGLWGGIIINGFAVTNRCEYIGSRTFNDSGSRDSDTLTGSQECHALSPITSLLGSGKIYYGGDNNLDNSGILSYVVVKHAGGLASGTPASITLNAVGERTQIDHIQVYSSNGDGVALIGGTAKIDSISAVYAKDDSLSIDEGYAGSISLGLLIQSQYNGNHCVESDGIGDYLSRSTETINDIVNRGLNSRPTLSNITCIFSPNGAPEAGDPLNPAKQGTYGPGAGYLLREGTYPQIIDSLTIGSFGAAINTANYGLRVDDIHTIPGFVDGFSQVKTSMFAVEFNDPDVDYQTSGVGDIDNPNPDGLGDNDNLKLVTLSGLDIKSWLTANGGNVFAEIADGGMDASTEGDAALELLEGAPPLFSIDGAFSEPAITTSKSAYAGGLNLGESDWAAEWNFGLYPDNRAKAAWFDIVGIDADPAIDTDTDGDGVVDLLDAFPALVGETLDTDGDGVGNNTDSDDDGDGVLDAKDAYPLVSLVGLPDLDGDGRPNECAAACVIFGMNADDDDDGDGIKDGQDPFPLFNTALLTDTDSDGIPNTCDAQCVAAGAAADPDDDNDGIADISDPFPLINLPNLVDTDRDGKPDTCDTACLGAGLTEDLDDDDDNVPDASDKLRTISVSGYADQDQDGLPNDCDVTCQGTGLYADTDDDGDGVADTADPFPLISVAGFPDEDNDGYPDVCNTTCLATGMTVEPGGPWMLVGDYLDGPDPGDRFGEAVAISGNGNIVAIGAYRHDLSTFLADAGKVQVWIWDGNDWANRGQFISGSAAGDQFGRSISMSANGNRILIGAPADAGQNAGYIEVWDWDQNANTYKEVF